MSNVIKIYVFNTLNKLLPTERMEQCTVCTYKISLHAYMAYKKISKKVKILNDYYFLQCINICMCNMKERKQAKI